MRKPKKLTAIGKIRAALKAAVVVQEVRLNTITRLAAQIKELETQLNEARRRTLPLGLHGSGGEANFLPSHIEKVETKVDICEVRSGSGARDYATSRSHAVIHVVGDIVYYPPPPAQKA